MKPLIKKLWMLPNKKFAKNLKGEIKSKKIYPFNLTFFWEIKMENSDIADFQPYPDIFVKLPDFLGSMPD